jgi:hypothetical protein
MNHDRWLALSSTALLVLALAVPARGLAPAGAGSAAATPTAPSAPAAGTAGAARRVILPGADGKPTSYSIEIPATWEIVHVKDLPGVFLGPPGMSAPESDPRAIYVRPSPASLAKPEEVVANIKRSDAADDRWTAPLVEVREVGGVRAVLVRMDSGAGFTAHSTLVLKLPLGPSSLDLMASAPAPEFERQLSSYQRIMFSVQAGK